MMRLARTRPASERSETAKREAFAWLSLLSSGTATAADAEALKRWCRADPAHAKAYAQAARVWQLLVPVAAEASASDAADVVWPILARSPVRRGVGRRAFLGGALAASAAAAAYALVDPPLGLWPSLAELGADVRTGTGEQRRVDIADGVAVDLNTRSSLAMRAASGGGSRIELIAGEAVVAVGPNAASPCVVIAQDGRTLARDARVDVRRDGGQVRVVCLAGSVQVEHQAHTVLLAAREQVVYDGRGIGATDVADPAIVAAWQGGRLVFRQDPLARVIDEVNRYRPGHIVLVNRELGRRLIDASFRLDRLDNVIVYLQQAFDARITALPAGVILVG